MKKENKSIYDKLNGLKAPINKDQSWNELYHRDGFPKKEKKRRQFLWIFFGLGSLLLVTSLVIKYNFSEPLPTKSDLPKSVKAEREVLATNPATRKDQKYSKTTESKNTDKEIISNENNKQLAITSELKENLSKNKTTQIKNTVVSNDEQINHAQKNTIYKASKQIIIHENNFHKTPSILDQTTENLLMQSVVIDSIKTSQQNDLRLATPLINDQISFAPLMNLKLFNVNKPSRPSFRDYDSTMVSSKIARKWTIEIGFGIGTGQHKIVLDSLSEDQTFQNNHTNSLASYMLDLRTTREINRNMRIAVGLRYTGNRRFFSLEDNTTTYTRQDRPDPYHYLKSTVTTVYKFYHLHHHLDLEALLMRDFRWKKTSAHVGIGLAMNTFYRFKAQGINADLLELDLEKAGNYKNNIGLHYLYEVGLSRQINHQYFINVSLSGKSGQDLNEGANHRVTPVFCRLGIGKRF